MRVLVTGSEGFLGRNMCAALPDVIPWDVKLGDMLNRPLPECDAVIHLAANADVRHGWLHPMRDLESTVFTAELLAAMVKAGIPRILYASSSAVYGNAPTPTPETYAGQQTSLYGASKLACDGLIGAYAAAGKVSATIFRLTSMLGPHYRHGLVADFTRSLRANPNLQVLGGGSVARTRMHVKDAVSAFVLRLPKDPGYEVFNVGTAETITSLEVARVVADELGIAANITTVEESWVGDHPILLDCKKLRATGWIPTCTIEDGVRDTVRWLVNHG